VNRFPHQVGGAVGALSELTASSRSLSRRTHRWATSILIDEFDAGDFQRATNNHVVGYCHRRLAIGELGAADGGDA
jgi:hypothetical protein